MKIEGALEATDLTEAELVHLRPKRGHGALLVLLLAILAFAAGLAVWDYAIGKASPLKPFAWAAGLGFLAACFLYSKREARQMLAQYKWLSERAHAEVLPEGLSWSTARGTALVPWDDLYGWREGPSLFLLYLAPEMYHLVPKRWFADASDVETFREALRRSVREL